MGAVVEYAETPPLSLALAALAPSTGALELVAGASHDSGSARLVNKTGGGEGGDKRTRCWSRSDNRWTFAFTDVDLASPTIDSSDNPKPLLADTGTDTDTDTRTHRDTHVFPSIRTRAYKPNA